MKKHSNLFLSLVSILCSLQTTAQTSRRCGTDEYIEIIKHSYPGYETQRGEIERAIDNYVAANFSSQGSRSFVKVPVVVHVVGNHAISLVDLAKVQEQINILNQDYRKMIGTNGDGTGVDTGIEFCLAQYNPSGGNSTGYYTYTGEFPEWNWLDPAEDATLKSLGHWPATSYLNLYVADLDSGFLGYATFPEDLSALPHLDGVVIDPDNFGNNSTIAQYNAGRTATHEVGHWLGLYHTWQLQPGDNQCDNTLCNMMGDKICDTPPKWKINSTINLYLNGPTYGCPASQVDNTCATDNDDPNFTFLGGDIPDITENYMEYTDDLCMDMFTQGQANRMIGVLNLLRSGILLSSCAEPVITPEHCWNGALDADEVVADCGGSDCPPCGNLQLCSSGIRDGNEIRVDCGGGCPTLCSDQETSNGATLVMTTDNHFPDVGQSVNLRVGATDSNLPGHSSNWSIQGPQGYNVNISSEHNTASSSISIAFPLAGLYTIIVYIDDENNPNADSWFRLEANFIHVGGFQTEACISQAYILHPILGGEGVCDPYIIANTTSSGTSRKERWRSENDITIDKLVLEPHAKLHIVSQTRIVFEPDADCLDSKIVIAGNMIAEIVPLACGTGSPIINVNTGRLSSSMDSTQIETKQEMLRDPLTLIFPNPSTGLITLSHPQQILQLEVYDPLGRQLLQTAPNATTTSIDLSGQPAGIYIIRAGLEDGSTETHRVVLSPP